MSAPYRTNRLASLLIVSAMIWGFAVPIVHLACGMAVDETAVLCEEHEAAPSPQNGHHVASHAHGEQPAARHAFDHRTDAAAHQQHRPKGVLDGAPYGTFVECCLVDAPPVDHRAQLVSLVHAPISMVTAIAPPVRADSSEPLITGAWEPSPPATLQVLFSVFLI